MDDEAQADARLSLKALATSTQSDAVHNAARETPVVSDNIYDNPASSTQHDVEEHVGPDTETTDTDHASRAQSCDEIATIDASSLSDEIRQIKDDLNAMSTYLLTLDKRSKPTLRVFFRGLRAQTWSGRWDELRGNFDDFLDVSRKSASKAFVLLKQHAVIVEINTLVARKSADLDAFNLEALKKEVLNLMVLLQHIKDVAGLMRQQVSRILDEIVLFKCEFQRRLESDKMPSQELHDNIAKTLNEISSLEGRLATLNAQVPAVSTPTTPTPDLASLARLLPGNAGSLSSLSLLESVFLAELETEAREESSTILSQDDARTLHIETRLLRAAINQKKRNVKRMKKDYDKGLCHLHEMERRVIAVGRLAHSVDAVAGIWNTICMDMRQVYELLEVVTYGEHVTPFFAEKLSYTRPVYLKLVEALFQYASALGAVGEKVHSGNAYAAETPQSRSDR